MEAELHVIIDGFNVIFGDDSLRTQHRKSPEDAKALLVKLAEQLHDHEGHQVSVVFDGQGRQIQIEHPNRNDRFSVIHSTSAMSADGVIERMISRSKQRDRLMVISNDRMIRDAALGNGVEFKGVEGFMDWVSGLQTRVTKTQQRRAGNPHTLDNRLPL